MTLLLDFMMFGFKEKRGMLRDLHELQSSLIFPTLFLSLEIFEEKSF